MRGLRQAMDGSGVQKSGASMAATQPPVRMTAALLKAIKRSAKARREEVVLTPEQIEADHRNRIQVGEMRPLWHPSSNLTTLEPYACTYASVVKVR